MNTVNTNDLETKVVVLSKEQDLPSLSVDISVVTEERNPDDVTELETSWSEPQSSDDNVRNQGRDSAENLCNELKEYMVSKDDPEILEAYDNQARTERTSETASAMKKSPKEYMVSKDDPEILEAYDNQARTGSFSETVSALKKSPSAGSLVLRASSGSDGSDDGQIEIELVDEDVSTEDVVYIESCDFSLDKPTVSEFERAPTKKMSSLPWQTCSILIRDQKDSPKTQVIHSASSNDLPRVPTKKPTAHSTTLSNGSIPCGRTTSTRSVKNSKRNSSMIPKRPQTIRDARLVGRSASVPLKNKMDKIPEFLLTAPLTSHFASNSIDTKEKEDRDSNATDEQSRQRPPLPPKTPEDSTKDVEEDTHDTIHEDLGSEEGEDLSEIISIKKTKSEESGLASEVTQKIGNVSMSMSRSVEPRKVLRAQVTESPADAGAKPATSHKKKKGRKIFTMSLGLKSGGEKKSTKVTKSESKESHTVVKHTTIPPSKSKKRGISLKMW